MTHSNKEPAAVKRKGKTKNSAVSGPTSISFPFRYTTTEEGHHLSQAVQSPDQVLISHKDYSDEQLQAVLWVKKYTNISSSLHGDEFLLRGGLEEQYQKLALVRIPIKQGSCSPSKYPHQYLISNLDVRFYLKDDIHTKLTKKESAADHRDCVEEHLHQRTSKGNVCARTRLQR
ncbi:hypothetical protein BV898_17360 [Hypsibius exemplaris]|uniref:Uncharacterized protein n=1 Tax=Hypsibius exemplaris TaxID=2072580 RepID=A0A9X6NH39_HYPEX|nr:hypothetical protein BV898_17360 [Hypsibius exemplaris]